MIPDKVSHIAFVINGEDGQRHDAYKMGVVTNEWRFRYVAVTSRLTEICQNEVGWF